MSKNIIYGAGILGIITAAVYIYQERKKAKEAEQESVVNIDSEAETEKQTKEEKKEVITEKVTSFGRKIGKTLGTAALKFGAKHPKITKFILKFGRYIPYALIGIAVLTSLPFYNRARDFMDGVDPDSVRVTEDGLEFTRNVPITDVASEEMSKEVKPWVANWDEKYRDNYNKVTNFAKTLELEEGEMYIIEDQKQYNVDSPDPCVSHLVNGEGAYPPESEQ